MDGDPLDACSMACFAALTCTKLPKVELIVGESGTFEDFDVLGDLAEGTNINTESVPVYVTISKV